MFKDSSARYYRKNKERVKKDIMENIKVFRIKKQKMRI